MLEQSKAKLKKRKLSTNLHPAFRENRNDATTSVEEVAVVYKEGRYMVWVWCKKDFTFCIYKNIRSIQQKAETVSHSLSHSLTANKSSLI